MLALPPELLPEHAVLWKTGLDQPPHRRFRGAVGGGNRAQIRLVVDCEGFAEIRPDHLSGGIGKVLCKGEKGIDINLGHRPILAC